MQLAGHAKVQPEPGPAGKLKHHLFAVGVAADEVTALESALHRSGSDVAINAGLGMGSYLLNGLAEAAIPLFAIEFNFSEFGHC